MSLDNENIAKIEGILGYTFKDKKLLNRALTRKAYAQERKQKNQECEDQEVFRTLGDAVLKAALVDLLIKSGCGSRKEITERKKGIEQKKSLAIIAKDLGIGPFIILGRGEKKQKIHRGPYVLAETLEALIGAIYLDRGFDSSREIVEKWFNKYVA